MSRGSITFKILMKLLSPQKSRENYETKIVKMTGEAYKKINLYSKIVSEIAGKDIECGGRMLNYYGRNDGVIRDAYLDYQIVKSDRIWYIDDEQTYVNYVQQLGMSWSGMWHSHGIYPPGHSRLDDKALKKLHECNKNSKWCMLKDEFYTPSVVINRDEYLNDGPCRSYYAEFLARDGKDDIKVKNVKLGIIEENNNLLPSLEEMVLEVGEKVRYKKLVFGGIMWGKKLKHFPEYYSILEKYKKLQISQVQGHPKDCVKQYSFNLNRKTIIPKKILGDITLGGKK